MKTLLATFSLLTALSLMAQSNAWHFKKADPATGRRLVEIDAQSSSEGTDGRINLHKMTAKFFDGSGGVKQIASEEAVIDERAGTLSYGPRLKSVVSLKKP